MESICHLPYSLFPFEMELNERWPEKSACRVAGLRAWKLVGLSEVEALIFPVSAQTRWFFLIKQKEQEITIKDQLGMSELPFHL